MWPFWATVLLYCAPDSGFQETECVFCVFVCLLVCFEESKILGFGVRNSAQGLRSSVIDWNPGSIISGAHNLWGSWLSGIGIQYPRLSWVSRTWGSVYSKNVRTMCERIKRLLDSDNRGGTLKEEGGGGSKNFLLLKKRKIFTPDRITHKIETFWGKIHWQFCSLPTTLCRLNLSIPGKVDSQSAMR